ncbi:MAG: nucleotidyltransferase domain-containing protein [Clostridia bacterium]|nr:nucleotidyltransferase domain-containing protein [Clostridia bacterium]
MIPDFMRLLASPAYDFLRENHHLGDRVMLLGLSGSYGYGTNREGSDVDFRGVALQRPSDILGLTAFEQYADESTDTVVYGFNKFVRLLLDANPNSMEVIGLPRDKYLMLSPLGEELLRNQTIFLSKRVIHSFGGYAEAQLRRLQNAIARDALPQAQREGHILASATRALEDYRRKNRDAAEAEIRLYLDEGRREELEKEIFLDIHASHMGLRDAGGLLETLHNVLRDYDKVGHRNHKKDANHLCKHAMHLVRLLMTATDILEKHEIITCRQEDLPLLMRIRNGGFLESDGTMNREFYEVLEMVQRRFHEAADHTTLPDAPDMDAVGRFVERVNRASIEIF